MAAIVVVTVAWLCLLPFLLVVMSGINRLGDEEAQAAAMVDESPVSRNRDQRKAA